MKENKLRQRHLLTFQTTKYKQKVLKFSRGEGKNPTDYISDGGICGTYVSSQKPINAQKTVEQYIQNSN